MKRTAKAAIAAGAVVVATGATAGIAVASGLDDNEAAITGDALQKASEAALDYTGEGTVTGTEVDDEESYYEVEVTLDDGSQVDVQLDEEFSVVGSEGDDENEDEELGRVGLRALASPDPDPLLGVEPEPVPARGLEHLVELVEVAHDVGAELRRAVRVDGEVLLLLLVAALGPPAVGPVEEQRPPRRPRPALAALGDQVRLVADRQAAEVADVLADRQRAVDVLAGQAARLEAVVLLDQRLAT